MIRWKRKGLALLLIARTLREVEVVEGRLLFIHSWQSHVEIRYYSVVYFEHITVFKALYLRTSIESGAQTRCLYALYVNPNLNGSSEIQCFAHAVMHT
jgi:hypothetical protein